MIKTHGNTGFTSCGVVHALHDNTVKLFNYGEPRYEFVSAEFADIIKQYGVTPCLLFSGLRPLAEMPGHAASGKNGDNATRQSTERPVDEYRSAKDQRRGVNDRINPAIVFFGYTFKPVAIPDSKYQIMFRVTFSGLFVHGYLILFIIPFVFFRRWGGFSEYVKFIFIRHYFLSLWGDSYAAHFFA